MVTKEKYIEKYLKTELSHKYIAIKIEDGYSLKLIKERIESEFFVQHDKIIKVNDSVIIEKHGGWDTHYYIATYSKAETLGEYKKRIKQDRIRIGDEWELKKKQVDKNKRKKDEEEKKLYQKLKKKFEK